MIIEGLFSVVITLLDILLFFEIPQLPETIYEYINPLVEYLSAGAGIVANYVPFGYVMTLFSLVVAIDVGIGIYNLVMWIIRKIPFLGMK